MTELQGWSLETDLHEVSLNPVSHTRLATMLGTVEQDLLRSLLTGWELVFHPEDVSVRSARLTTDEEGMPSCTSYISDVAATRNGKPDSFDVEKATFFLNKGARKGHISLKADFNLLVQAIQQGT